MSRSQLKVTSLSLEFHVRSIFPLPLKGFLLSWSNVWLSETMCRTHNSILLTQGQGHKWRSRVWALILCLLHISFTPGRIFNKLWLKIMCSTYNSTILMEGQGHKWRKNFVNKVTGLWNVGNKRPSFKFDLEIIKANILSMIHDAYLKNVTSRVLTRFSFDLAWWPIFFLSQVSQFQTWPRNHQDKYFEQGSWRLLQKCGL